MKKYLPVLSVLGLFLVLVLYSGPAAAGARHGLEVCAATLVPSLLPFFVLSNLLSMLGLADLLGGLFGGAMARLFRTSPAGAQALFLGLSGGYPLGASVVADLRRQGRVSREEAERLLAFCNNSGPAFILGAAGGVLKSPQAGAMLYLTHVLAAITVGVLMRPSGLPQSGQAAPVTPPLPFGKALTAAVTRAVNSTLMVCGYVVLFGALLGFLTPLATLPPLWQSAVSGILELGSGIAALTGMTPTPAVLAAAAFLLGWGGLSVHCQTMGVLADTDIKCARHLAGRALCGLLAAVYTLIGALLIF